MDLIVRNGLVVSSSGRAQMDIGIKSDRIVSLGSIEASDVPEIDAHGLIVVPGAIDTQVHFREPGMTHKEDIESGSRAALFGGVTTYFEMPNTVPNTTTAELLQDKLDRSRDRAWVNYAYFVGASKDNLENLSELELLPGTPGIKIFAGSSTGSLLVDSEEDLLQVLRNGMRPTSVHSEDETTLRLMKEKFAGSTDVRDHPHIRSVEAAVTCTKKLLRLSEQTGRAVHILHISTADEIELIREAKSKGVKVTCEVTPQHLTFNDTLYDQIGTKAQMNPPIRSEEHRAAIFKAFTEGFFDVVGSDHAPHTAQEKDQPYPMSPSGMPGVQTLLPVMMRLVKRGDVSLETVIRFCCENPASLFGICDRGKIKVDNYADLVLLDPDEPFTVSRDWLQSKCGWSPFEGETLYGQPKVVIVNGKVTLRENKLLGKASGQPVKFTWKPIT